METHLAKLFKQKMEIFTKDQHTQVGTTLDKNIQFIKLIINEHCRNLL